MNAIHIKASTSFFRAVIILATLLATISATILIMNKFGFDKSCLAMERLTNAGERIRTFEGTKPIGPKPITFDHFVTPADSQIWSAVAFFECNVRYAQACVILFKKSS